MNKEEVSALIGWLERFRYENASYPKNLTLATGVLIGDVLEKTDLSKVRDLVLLWMDCGASKSLQEIEECIQWGANWAGAMRQCGKTETVANLKLKDDNARALFEFLNYI